MITRSHEREDRSGRRQWREHISEYSPLSVGVGAVGGVGVARAGDAGLGDAALPALHHHALQQAAQAARHPLQPSERVQEAASLNPVSAPAIELVRKRQVRGMGKVGAGGESTTPGPLLAAAAAEESATLGSGAIIGTVLGVIASLTLLSALLYGALRGFGRQTPRLPPPRLRVLAPAASVQVEKEVADGDEDDEDEEEEGSSLEDPEERLVSLTALTPDSTLYSVRSTDAPGPDKAKPDAPA